jgi:membrane associated rhomboid family serine protease
MTASSPTPDVLLRLCAATTPWFPSDHARASGTRRDDLDEPLARLRLAGLIQIGGWEAGKGQWYKPTEIGQAALADPPSLARLLDGKSQAPPPPAGPRPERITAWDRGEAVRAAFMPNGRPTPVLYAVIAAQAIVFIAGLALAQSRGAPLSQYLSNGIAGQEAPSPVTELSLFVPAVARGEWWRLLTYALVHFGGLHLLMNLYGHAALGPIVERMYGSVRFLALYLLSTLGGAIAAVLLSRPEAMTAGSSGALCGLIGGFAAFVLLNRRHLGHELYDHSRRWLGNTLVLLVMFSLLPRVSWQGHLGGFVAGFISGVLLTYHRFGTAEQRWAALLGLMLLPIAGLAPLVERHILRLPEPAGDERTEFGRHVVPAVNEVRARTAAVNDTLIDPLRRQMPEARDPRQVKQARAELATIGGEQDGARILLERAGPFHEPVLEKAREAARQYVATSLQATKALDVCLDQGRNWSMQNQTAVADEDRLQYILNLALEADLRWQRLSHEAAVGP